MQKFARGVMRRRLLVELPFERSKKLVEFSRFNHGPRDNLQFSCMQTSDEVGILLVLNYFLEFERESRWCQQRIDRVWLKNLLPRNFSLVRVDDVLKGDISCCTTQ
jgi:hypothetical protein